MTRLVCYGDSITTGGGLTAQQMYANQLGTALGIAVVNRAVSGSMMADQAMDIYAFKPLATDIVTIMLGTNDQRFYGVNAARQAADIEILRNIVVMAGTSAQSLGTSWTKSSGWTNTPDGYFGIFSDSAGDVASVTVSGSTVWVGYIVDDLSIGHSRAIVKIDGVQVDEIISDASGAGVTSYLNRQWAPAARRYSGLSSGSHTVEVTTQVAGNRFWLEYAAGSANSAGAKVAVSNIIPITASAQGAIGAGGSDANIASYNSAIATLVSQAVTDGLNVALIDNHAALTLATDYQLDVVHPNASGNVKVEAAFYAPWAPPPPTYVDAKIQVDAAGIFYGAKVDGTGRVRLSP